MRRFIISLLLALPLIGSAQQWVIDLKDENHHYFAEGIVNDCGDIIVVGDCGENVINSNPMMVRVSGDGDYDMQVVNDNLLGFLNQGLNMCGVTQLSNRNYFSTVSIPVSESGTAKFGIVVFSDDFEVISSKLYNAVSIAEDVFTERLLLDDDGTVVLCGHYKYTKILSNGWEVNVSRPFFYRFDEIGDSLSCRYVYPTTSSDPEYFIDGFGCNQIKRDPRSDGFIVFGDGNNGCNSVLFYDRDFNYISQFCPHYNNSSKPLFDYMNSDTWLDNDRMLVYGHGLGSETTDLLIADISFDGTVHKYCDIYSITDTCINVNGVNGVTMINDTTIYGYYYFYENFKSYHRKVGVCLFTKNMEVLSIKTLPSSFNDCYPKSILSLSDGGFVLVCSRVNYDRYHYDAVAIKLSREDLNPIPCGVKEVTKERLKATAFPNPTHGELNIDISNLPDATENRVSITDMQGIVRMSRIIRGDGNLLTIDASSLEAGTYVYSVFNKHKELLKGKFVKE